MSMTITFPGGAAVEAHFEGFTVHTDQSAEHGGRGAAPEPFDLFLASLGTCAGLFALRFCQQRGIETEGLGVTLTVERNLAAKRLAAVRLEIQLPPGFPEKYREAIVRAADQCTVKRHILEPPAFEVIAVPAGEMETVEA
jgi:ribosomal protein S12 methylthiotransferase accessory factor